MKAADVTRGVALAALVAGGAVHAQPLVCPVGNEWPTKLRLEYSVGASRGPLSISGDSVLVFERSGSAYTLGIDTDSTVIYHARQSSRGTIDATGLRPTEYVEERSRRTPQTTTVDWDGKTVRFSAAPDTVAVPPVGLQDRASLLLQTAWRLRTDAKATTFEVPVVGARRVVPYRFARHGVEQLKLPIGSVQAIRLEREADDEQDKIEAWFASSWCGLPVRIRYTDRNGGVIDHRLRGVKID